MKEKSALKTIREQLGKTQAQVADEVGIPYQYYQIYEYGRGANAARREVTLPRLLSARLRR